MPGVAVTLASNGKIQSSQERNDSMVHRGKIEGCRASPTSGVLFEPMRPSCVIGQPEYKRARTVWVGELRRLLAVKAKRVTGTPVFL